MATNKRKEAAALFELIDKSTLKVPKNSGSLKIPSWWSSKTNPPVNGAATIAAPRGTSRPVNGGTPPSPAAQPELRQSAAAPAPALPETSSESPDATGADSVPTPAATSDPAPARQTPVQNRLFQPPPPDAAESPAPSIRPPARTPVTSAPAAPPAAAPVNPLAMEPLTEEEGPGSEPAGVAKPPARPPTAAPAIATGLSAQRRRSANFTSIFENIPRPVLIGSAIGGGVLLLLILFLAFRGSKAPAPVATNNTTPTQITGPGGNQAAPHSGNGDGNTANNTPGHGLLDHPGPGANHNAPGTPDNAHPGPGNSAAGTAKVYEPLTFPFQPTLVYWVLESDSSESVARRNAKFLADHGVDVAIEKTKKGYWVLVATQGFANNDAAEPFRKRLAELAKLHPEYKTTHRIWADAAPNRITFGASSK